MAEPFIGEIKLMGCAWAPRDYAYCAGQILPISENQALFSIVSTYYGGDGMRTFGLPNLCDRVPVHVGGREYNGSNTTIATSIGEKQGFETISLIESQIPSHGHGTIVTGVSATLTSTPSGAVIPGLMQQNLYYSGGDSAITTMSPSALSITGSSIAHENRQPFLVMNYCISLEGYYPPRT